MGFFSGGGGESVQNSSSYSGLDPKALNQWNTLFTGAQQGVAPWQQQGFLQAMNQALTKFSGSNAAAGGLTPYSLPQIASSAAQYVAPQFAEMNTNLLGNLLGQRQISRSQSTGFTKQTAPGIGYDWAKSFGNSFNLTGYTGSGKGMMGAG